MTKQARISQLDSEKRRLFAQIAEARVQGRTEPSLMSRVRELSAERVRLATA